MLGDIWRECIACGLRGEVEKWVGTVPAKLSKSQKLKIDDVIGSLQTAVLISTTAIPRRVVNL